MLGSSVTMTEKDPFCCGRYLVGTFVPMMLMRGEGRPISSFKAAVAGEHPQNA